MEGRGGGEEGYLKITKNISKSLMLRINGVTFECARPYRVCPFI